MLTGGLPALSSRMRFGYEFVLRNALATEAHEGGTGIDIAGASYWAVQQRASRVCLGAELDRVEVRILETERSMPAGIEAALIEKAALQAEIAQTVNAKRKKAQAALARWELDHADDLPKGSWSSAEKTWARLRELQRERDELRRQAATWDTAPLLSLGTQEDALVRWGFLEKDGLRLTLLGRSATEINEGHPILMATLAESGKLRDASAADIAIVLAAFSREAAGPEEEQPCIADLEISPVSRAALEWIGDTADCLSREDVTSPTGYWSLNTTWPAIVARWLEGAPLATLATEFGLFEGNIQRGLLKIANLLEEWGAVATVRTDLATLEKLAAFRFLNDEIIVDSIYLRM
jgi:superfamily II RNA helicase